MSNEHGERDPFQQKWFCAYWMSQEEWMDIHGYAHAAQKSEADEEAEEE